MMDNNAVEVIEASLSNLSIAELLAKSGSTDNIAWSSAMRNALCQHLRSKGVEPNWSDHESLEQWQVDLICNGFNLKHINYRVLLEQNIINPETGVAYKSDKEFNTQRFNKVNWLIERNLLTEEQKVEMINDIVVNFKDVFHEHIGLVYKMLDHGMWSLEHVRMHNNALLSYVCNFRGGEANGFHVTAEDLVQKLIDLGLTANDMRDNNNQALYMVCYMPRTNPETLFRLFLANGITREDFRADDNRLLKRSVRCGRMPELLFLWEMRFVNIQDLRAHDNEILRHACADGDYELVRLLFEWGLGTNDLNLHAPRHDELRDIIIKYDYLEPLLRLQDRNLSVVDVFNFNSEGLTNEEVTWRESMAESLYYHEELDYGDFETHEDHIYVRLLEVFLEFGILTYQEVSVYVLTHDADNMLNGISRTLG
jgi:hypothetical protein